MTKEIMKSGIKYRKWEKDTWKTRSHIKMIQSQIECGL